MTSKPFKHVLLMLFIAVVVAACAAPEPYVWRPYAIDREAADFPYGPELEVGSVIQICYSKSGATPQKIRQLANKECQRFGLAAHFEQTEYKVCPLLTPVTAEFSCKLPAGQAKQDASGDRRKLFLSPNENFQARGAALPPMRSAISADDVSTTAKSQPYPTFLFNGPQKQEQ